jgi:phosphatidylglycerol:prolipoprotein diacylglycerol transferase
MIISKKENQRDRKGELFLIYLIIYAVGRFLLEFIRLDASFVSTINANQLTMAVVAVISIVLVVVRKRNYETMK